MKQSPFAYWYSIPFYRKYNFLIDLIVHFYCALTIVSLADFVTDFGAVHHKSFTQFKHVTSMTRDACFLSCLQN